jgi:hypothetical protein
MAVGMDGTTSRIVFCSQGASGRSRVRAMSMSAAQGADCCFGTAAFFPARASVRPCRGP